LNGEQRIFQNCKARKEIGDLIGPRESERRTPMRRQARHIPAQELNSSFRRSGFSADQAKERCLSGAVWADDRSALSGCDGKADTVYRAKAVERFRDVGKAQSNSGRVGHSIFRLALPSFSDSSLKFPSLKKRGQGDFYELLGATVTSKSPSLPFAKGGIESLHRQRQV
jgi:hypothetical protein